MKKAYPLTTLCSLLNVSSSAYYAWAAKQDSIDARRVQLRSEVKVIAKDTRHSYGSRRMSRELCDRGHRVGRHQAASLMREAGVVAKVSKPHRYPRSGLPDVVAPNHLNRQFDVATPNTVWAGDITYIATAQGWLYLAVVIDLYSRRVVGWAFSDSPDTDLVTRALRLALMTRPRTTTLMFHSDQGCQYTSEAFRRFLTEQRIVQSMSRRGNCWDNAVVERFFRSLKTERTHYQPYRNHVRAEADIKEYIAVFYNHYRLHSAAGNQSPANFEALYDKAA